jgi:periplasmic copper chaperone A
MGHWGERPGKADRDDDPQARRPAVRDPSTMARGVPKRRSFMRKLLLSSALLSLGLSSPVAAHHEGEIYQLGKLVISHAWMHENAGMAHATSVYLTIDNPGPEADRLIGAAADFADEATFQAQTVSSEGVLEVRDVDGVRIHAEQVLTLKPGVVWIELESVHREFEHGDHFDMRLTFEKAGTIEIEVEIEPLDRHGHEETDETS